MRSVAATSLWQPRQPLPYALARYLDINSLQISTSGIYLDGFRPGPPGTGANSAVAGGGAAGAGAGGYSAASGSAGGAAVGGKAGAPGGAASGAAGSGAAGAGTGGYSAASDSAGGVAAGGKAGAAGMGASGDAGSGAAGGASPGAAAGVAAFRFSGREYHRNRTGGNLVSAQGETRALDIHLSSNRPDQKLIADKLWRILIANAVQLGLDKVVWNRTIWNRVRGQQPYHGSDPDFHFIHVEFTWSKRPDTVLGACSMVISRNWRRCRVNPPLF